MVAVDQHLGLDDGHHALLLADRRVARQASAFASTASAARQRVGDVVDRAPLGEARALLPVAVEALGESVQALRDLVARRQRQRNLAGVDLDAGHDALARRQLRQRRAVVGTLAERLFVQDDAADEFAEPGRREQQAAPGAPVSSVDSTPIRESLGDGRAAFVGGEDALAGLHHCLDGALEVVVCVHGMPPRSAGRTPAYAGPRRGDDGSPLGQRGLRS